MLRLCVCVHACVHLSQTCSFYPSECPFSSHLFYLHFLCIFLFLVSPPVSSAISYSPLLSPTSLPLASLISSTNYPLPSHLSAVFFLFAVPSFPLVYILFSSFTLTFLCFFYLIFTKYPLPSSH